MSTNGITPSPLFQAPGFTLLMVAIDVLHALDLGVTQDMLGNLLWESLDVLFMEGKNKAGKLNLLWLRITRSQTRSCDPDPEEIQLAG